MAQTPWILSNSLVTEIILPFLLVFVVIFAVLDRTKILGEGKNQINALVSLAIALIFVTFSRAVGIVTNLMAFLAVFIAILLVFFLLYGFVAADKEGLKIPTGIKITGGIIILIALLVAVLVVTGYWDKLLDLFKAGSSNAAVSSIVLLAIVAGAVAVVLTVKGKSGS
jgi:hypothetical protein